MHLLRVRQCRANPSKGGDAKSPACRPPRPRAAGPPCAQQRVRQVAGHILVPPGPDPSDFSPVFESVHLLCMSCGMGFRTMTIRAMHGKQTSLLRIAGLVPSDVNNVA